MIAGITSKRPNPLDWGVSACGGRKRKRPQEPSLCRRRRPSRVEAARLVVAFEQSSLTQQAFCAQHGIAPEAVRRPRLPGRIRMIRSLSTTVSVWSYPLDLFLPKGP